MTPPLVTLADVQAAAERIGGVVNRTPLIPDPDLSDEVGGRVWLKCESLQKAGSFKARGASNFLARLPDDVASRGVITYSSGNHAQAVAFAAGLKGVRAVVVMPTTAPKVKSEGARRLGATVEFAGTTSNDRKLRAEEIAEAEGLVMVPPFDHPDIIAGQGTVALEVFEDLPDVQVFLVPIGGGGQASGCAAALRALKPDTVIIGVEPKGAPTMRTALDEGGPVTLPGFDTIADGLAPVRAGDLTYAHARALLDDVVLVDDDAIERATAHLLKRRKLVVEYSGAATVAALRSGGLQLAGKTVCAVVSGGNMDPSFLPRVAAVDPAA
ncbi:MAG: pyridoxal-phosphate dependent enzyme [Gemmatimonadota bacterium]|nr:pyridoxal-phosphate dependent enzyme [Gemmatimonadota bacterium]